MSKARQSGAIPDRIRGRMSGYPAATDSSFQGIRAAVLIPIVCGKEPVVVLTLRADGLSSHGGEVALPGGKYDFEDGTLLVTALREAEEEIGLPREEVEVVGRLKPFISKHGLQVTPFVGLVPEGIKLTPNQHELETIFQVPVDYLCADPRTSTEEIFRHGVRLRMPTYYYEGHKIWGLTAMILVEFLNVALDAAVP